VIFMGLRRLARIASNLILNGRPADEPAAAISKVSLPDQQLVVATLGSIADSAAGLGSPTIVIVGRVAALGLLDAAPLRHSMTIRS
jgi:siroheme synthase